MKRIFLFLLTNMAVMLVITLVVNLLGLNPVLQANNLNLPSLLAFSAVVGFTGSIISLLMSKKMAKMSMGVKVIETPQSQTEQWLVSTVKQLSDKAGITMPEVGIYQGPANAFATGAFKNSALVAVSTGLMESMNSEEVEAVLAHEVAHVANGDMVTLALIQGVVNTFVVFFAKIAGVLLDGFLRGNSNDEQGERVGIGYYIGDMLGQILFGVLASIVVAWFSRQREYRADAGSAQYLGSPDSMIRALKRLGGIQDGGLPKSLAASGIGGGLTGMALFMSHPPIEQRIAALQGQNKA